MTYFCRFKFGYSGSPDYIFAFALGARGWIILRHQLVVGPSPPLGLSTAVRRLAADWPPLAVPAIHPIFFAAPVLMHCRRGTHYQKKVPQPRGCGRIRVREICSLVHIVRVYRTCKLLNLPLVVNSFCRLPLRIAEKGRFVRVALVQPFRVASTISSLAECRALVPVIK